MEDKANKSGAILELIADLSIANKQLMENEKTARIKYTIEHNSAIDFEKRLREVEKRVDRVVTSITNTIKNGGVVTKDDVIFWRDILEKGDE